MKCPCSEKKLHLGISNIISRKSECSSKQNKLLRKFFLGNGVTIKDPIEAANHCLHRDHRKLVKLLEKYHHGQLGLYMVPPMFYGQVPEAINLSEYKVKKHIDNVKGDLAERAMFFALEKYFLDEGDDVMVIHSHKFVNSVGNNEKDFIILNLTKGMILLN